MCHVYCHWDPLALKLICKKKKVKIAGIASWVHKAAMTMHRVYYEIHVIKRCWTDRRMPSPHDSSRRTTSHWQNQRGPHSSGIRLHLVAGTGSWWCPSFWTWCWLRAGLSRCPRSSCRWRQARPAHLGRRSGGCTLWVCRSRRWTLACPGRHPGSYSLHSQCGSASSQGRPDNTCHGF